MEKKRLIIISIIVVGVVVLFGVAGVLIYQYFANKNNVKVFDVDFIKMEAVSSDNLFRIQCDKIDNVIAGDDITCNVSISPNLQNYSIMDDVLEYISFDYDLGENLSFEEVTIQSPYNNEVYSQFVLDTSEKNKIILKNNNRHDFHKDVICDSDGNNCHIYGRTFYKVNDSNKEVYYDSISNLLFQLKIKVSKKATYSEPLKIDIHDLYIYSCSYGMTEEDDIKNIYKMENLVYEFSVNKLKSDSNSKVLYQVKVESLDGAAVYVDYTKDVIGNNLEKDKVVDVIGDAVTPLKNRQSNKFVFENYKNNYYYLVKIDDKVGYVKYSDVEVVSDSVHTDNQQANKKFYVYNDEYLYKAPGLYAQDTEFMIPKGTIINSSIYYYIGSACWLYVDYNGNKGWILEANHSKENYPYNNIAYGSANLIEDKKGSINIGDKNTSLFKYAFSSDKAMDLPKNVNLTYDYITTGSGVIYYHVVYNGVEGWIKS